MSTDEVDSMLTITETNGHLDAFAAKIKCEEDSKRNNKITNEQYKCISDSFEAIDNDLFYDVSSRDIDSMLQIPEMRGHVEAIRAARACGVR